MWGGGISPDLAYLGVGEGGVISLSAYADDVCVLLRIQGDAKIVKKDLEQYERASSAKVNWGKSKG